MRIEVGQHADAVRVVMRHQRQVRLRGRSRQQKQKRKNSFHRSVSSADRVVHGDQLGAVGKGRLDLNVVDHLGDAVHDLGARDHMGAGFHQVGDAAAVARAFQDEIGDQRHRLRDG